MAKQQGLKLNGPAIKEIRSARGLTVSEAATEAGVTQPTWSNWEAGRKNASAASVRRITEILLIQDVRAVLWPTVTVELSDLVDEAA